MAYISAVYEDILKIPFFPENFGKTSFLVIFSKFLFVQTAVDISIFLCLQKIDIISKLGLWQILYVDFKCITAILECVSTIQMILNMNNCFIDLIFFLKLVENYSQGELFPVLK